MGTIFNRLPIAKMSDLACSQTMLAVIFDNGLEVFQLTRIKFNERLITTNREADCVNIGASSKVMVVFDFNHIDLNERIFVVTEQ